MTAHDPLCPCFPDCSTDSCTKCRCEEYARVRADERDAARAEVERLNEQYEATANAYLDEQERVEALRAEVAALRTSHRAALRDIAALEKQLADLREQVEAVRELLHRQRVLHGNLIAPTHPNAPVLVMVDQVLDALKDGD